MGLNDSLARITDPYERQARLWPALLALLPLISMVGLLYASSATIAANAIAIAISCGALYLLTGIRRKFGRRLEPKLFDSRGGKPSTLLLRHRDSTIEGVTKRRYHSFLAAKIDSPFPNESQEASDPKSADEIYQSAVRWLLNSTRDTKQFGLLFQENIAYGFRRNALSLKPLGLLIACGCIVWVLTTHDVIFPATGNFLSISALQRLPVTEVMSLTVSAGMFLAWVTYFTKKSVRSSAFTYAEMLLRACDILAPTLSKSRAARELTAQLSRKFCADKPHLRKQTCHAPYQLMMRRHNMDRH